jgi:Dyp-type peroxidase family
MPDALEFADIQGLVVRGYGNLPAACYVLIEIPDSAVAGARNWLGWLPSELNTAQLRPDDSAANVAFTYAGLKKLGVPTASLAMFPPEFVDGMVDSHRSRILGDVDESAPEYWDWGGPLTTRVDAVLLLFAVDNAALEQLCSTHQQQLEQAGLRELVRLDTSDLGGREHFGFRDGISQPTIAGFGRTDAPMNTIEPGEFVLGYHNERGQFAQAPDFGRDGSYLVFRQLRQDVPGFWRFVDAATRNLDGSSDESRRTRLAAKLVGRWPSGAPLVKVPDGDDPTLATDNDFAYAANDPYGLNCPIGSHIRRGNPRDSLEPGPGTQQSINVGKHHRLIRRGREYGPPVDRQTLFTDDAPAGDDVDRGLHFICLCSDIARQFEFVQHTWLMSTKFSGLYDDADPLLGAPPAGYGTFTVQAQPLRQRYSGLSRLVSVRGGAYFFLPGIRATKYLATLRS